VIVPSYNERGNVRPVILSILRQEVGVTEIVVVNDGSPDITPEHGKRTSLSDAQSRLISRKAERGLAAAEGV
jgi:glycosyltransferase involved in cell wall biosynthesis